MGQIAANTAIPFQPRIRFPPPVPPMFAERPTPSTRRSGQGSGLSTRSGGVPQSDQGKHTAVVHSRLGQSTGRYTPVVEWTSAVPRRVRVSRRRSQHPRLFECGDGCAMVADGARGRVGRSRLRRRRRRDPLPRANRSAVILAAVEAEWTVPRAPAAGLRACNGRSAWGPASGWTARPFRVAGFDAYVCLFGSRARGRPRCRAASIGGVSVHRMDGAQQRARIRRSTAGLAATRSGLPRVDTLDMEDADEAPPATFQMRSWHGSLPTEPFSPRVRQANGAVRLAEVVRQVPGLPSMAGSAARSRVL